MTMFGINIKINVVQSNDTFIESEVNNALKRNSERKVFKNFLNSSISTGEIIIDTITSKVRNYLDSDDYKKVEVSETTLLEFATSNLKRKSEGGLNTFDKLTRKIIEDQNPKFKSLHINIDKGKFNGKLPLGYPDASKNAQIILTAKVKDSLGKIRDEYLRQKLTGEIIRKYSKEMFYGVNKLNLNEEQLFKYMNIIYELNFLETAPSERPTDLRFLIAKSLKDNEPIQLVHIKCLRFVYLRNGGFEIIPNTEDVKVENVLGKGTMIPKSERLFEKRIDRIRNVFQRHGIISNIFLLVADDDLDIYFPDGTKIVEKQYIKEAELNIRAYVSFLTSRFGDKYSIFSMKDIILNLGQNYQDLKVKVIKTLKNSTGQYVNPNYFEHDRIDHQFEYFGAIFKGNYSREEARRCSEDKIASIIALEKILESLGKNNLLIEEDMVGENKLIANGSVPILFTKLRDDAKFDVE